MASSRNGDYLLFLGLLFLKASFLNSPPLFEQTIMLQLRLGIPEKTLTPNACAHGPSELSYLKVIIDLSKSQRTIFG
ncbi:MAG: hypothetical protein BWZ03_00391 [bacterium ADurb.BinA186]|nr:MAG: hypothetical protein BWZ03_00391 [bacterium ADurb.BinA186]